MKMENVVWPHDSASLTCLFAVSALHTLLLPPPVWRRLKRLSLQSGEAKKSFPSPESQAGEGLITLKIQGIYGSQLGSEPSVMDIKWKQPCSGCRAKKAEQAFDLFSDLPGHCPDCVPDSEYTNHYQ